MPYHHLALAVRDMPAIDAFYTHAMGFDLVHVEANKTPQGGWAKHFFYDTGGGEMMAFWELHEGPFPTDFETSLSGAVGLPPWTNHIAFQAADLDEIGAFRDRWLENGYDVIEIDHNWCVSIYTTDPNGTLVEFCVTTAPFDERSRARARKAVVSDEIDFDSDPTVTFHKTELEPIHVRQPTRP
jgi:catechol 2,3-dioxygenase-like lactoylglutathione lyase family enzyme